MPPSSRSNLAKVLVISCTHAPFTPKKVWDWVLKEASAEKGITHVVHLGDWIDTTPASLYPTEYAHDQQDEYEEACRQSKALRAAVGGRPILIRHDGNHEDRLEPASMNVHKGIRRMVHWTKHTDLSREWRDWKWVPYVKGKAGITQIGQVGLFHGFDTSSTSDELESIQMAMLLGGQPNMLLVRGHTHRPAIPTQCMKTKQVPLPWWWANVGHTGPSKPTFVRRENTIMWKQGLMVIEAKIGDRLVGKNWDAELRTFPGGADATQPKAGKHPLLDGG